jgi:uncharacterized repeat protein (TIGR01451 family)
VGSPATYIECYQWFLAPTDLNGENPDLAKAPQVISNSWGCPTSEGCTDPNVMIAAVDNVRAAGILTVHSAGNDCRTAPCCGSINTPAAIYASSFTVANTTREGALYYSSSRGPVVVDQSGRRKPDIAAPGTGIISSLSGGGYGSMTGTSMASPHVAGLVALLISARPDLAGQVDLLETVIERSAVALPFPPSEVCGNISASERPNNSYGWGRIDSWQAYQSVLLIPHLDSQVSAEGIPFGATLTYTFTVTNQHPLSTTHHLVLSDTLPAGAALITATLPFTQTGNSIVWNKASLLPGESWSVNLVVQATAPGVGNLINTGCRAVVDEMWGEVKGKTLTTRVGYTIYLPLF